MGDHSVMEAPRLVLILLSLFGLSVNSLKTEEETNKDGLQYLSGFGFGSIGKRAVQRIVDPRIRIHLGRSFSLFPKSLRFSGRQKNWNFKRAPKVPKLIDFLSNLFMSHFRHFAK